MSTPQYEKHYVGPTGRKRLLRTYERTNTRSFDDLLLCCAVTVEDAMLASGAEPGVDYSRLALFRLAMPLALAASRKADTTITTGIPDTHPSAGLIPKNQYTNIESEVLELIATLGPINHQKISAAFRHRGQSRAAAAAAKSLHNKGLVNRELVRTERYARSGYWVYVLANQGDHA